MTKGWPGDLLDWVRATLDEMVELRRGSPFDPSDEVLYRALTACERDLIMCLPAAYN